MASDRVAAYVPRHEEFKRGDRIHYVNDPTITGTVQVVTPDGYRIKWDDGYKDERGPEGCYGDHELLAVADA